MSRTSLGGFLAAAIAASALAAEGKHVVFVIDTSGSMIDNDPHRYNQQGPQLAVALSGRKDKLGVVTFSTNARVLVGMQELSSVDVRRAVQEKLQRIRPRGRTNYIAALDAAYRMLDAAGAGPEAAVVFLSDGTHTVGGRKSQVIAGAKPFTDRGWRIFTIGLGARLDSELLEHLAVRTGGAFFPVVKAPELLTAFLKIFEIIHGYFRSTGVAPTLALPGTERLVAVSIKSRRGGEIQDLLREGGAAPPEKTYRFPERPSRKIKFEAVLIEDPEPGVWEPQVQGEPEYFAILQKLPYVTRFDKEAPRPLYYEDEEVPIALVVEASSREVLETFRENVSVACSVTSASTDSVAAELELQPRMAGDALRYEGTVKVELSEPGKEERFVVKASSLIAFRSRGDQKVRWASEQAVTITVKPGSRPSMLVMNPKPLELGQHWLDEEAFAGTVTVASKIQERLQLHVESANEGVVVSPVDLVVTSTDARDVEVRIEPDKFPDPGVMEERLSVTGLVQRTQEELPPDALLVKFSLHRFTGPEGEVLELGEWPPGESLIFPLGVAVEPEVEVAFQLSEMRGPSPLTLIVGKAVPTRPAAPEEAPPPALEEGAPAPAAEEGAPALEEEKAPEAGAAPAPAPEEELAPVIEEAPDGGGEGQEVDCVLADLPLDQAPGEYTGELTISFPGTTLSPRKYKLRLLVQLPEAGITVEPEVLELSATDKGEVLGELTLKFEFLDNAIMSCEGTDLVKKIELGGVGWRVTRDLGDVATSPAGPVGWNGNNVEPGGSYQYGYRAFVYADLPNGLYEGKVVFIANYKGMPVARKEVPVVLKVSR